MPKKKPGKKEVSQRIVENPKPESPERTLWLNVIQTLFEDVRRKTSSRFTIEEALLDYQSKDMAEICALAGVEHRMIKTEFERIWLETKTQHEAHFKRVEQRKALKKLAKKKRADALPTKA